MIDILNTITDLISFDPSLAFEVGPLMLGQLMEPKSSTSSSSTATADDEDEELDPVESDPEPKSASFEETFGGIEDNISPDQVENLRSIFNQQSGREEVDEETTQGLTGVSDEDQQRVREIANQDFVSDEVTENVNNLFGPRSVSEQEEQSADVPSSADEAVSDIENNPLTSEEFSSQFSGNDFISQVDDYMSRLQDLQGKLAEAQTPSQEELDAREDLDNFRQSFREKRESIKNRQAPMFAIRGDKARANREFSIQKQGLVDDLERLRNERSSRIDQLTQRMQFNNQNFKLMQDLQDLQTPNTRQFKTVDGTMYAIQENPMTGEISSKAVMNVPESSNVQWQGFRKDDTTGRVIRWGTKGSGEDSEIIQQEMPEGFTARDVGIGQETTGGGTGGGGIDDGGQELSQWQINQIRKNYGFVPPVGSTMNEVETFVKNNKNKTGDELQEIINNGNFSQTTSQKETQQSDFVVSEDWIRNNFTTDQLNTYSDKAGISKWWRGGSGDINAALPKLMTRISKLVDNGYNEEEIKGAINKIVNSDG